MKPKIILTVIAAIAGIVAMSQSDLKLKLDSIANLGIEQGIPGIQILISKKGQSDYHNYGFQDIYQTSTINDSTIWRYGSITKLLTTVVILQLESEGKLNTADCITNHLDMKFHTDDSITIKHLLNHTSGLYNYTSDWHLSKKRMRKKKHANISMQQCAEYGLKRKLNFEPGSLHKYCNTGFVILGLIIEEITQKSIYENFQDRIFIPCGLSSMTYPLDEKVPDNTARGYIKKRKKYIDYTEIHHGWANSAGAVFGTANDLLKFNQSIFDGTLLDSTQLNKMISPTIIFRDLDAEGKEWYYHAIGMGFFLNLNQSGKSVYISHGGNTLGYNCNIHYNLENDMTIIVGMNLFPNGNYEPVFHIQNELIDLIHKYYKRNE